MLIQLFTTKLQEIAELEKLIGKRFKQLERKALSDELSKCLSVDEAGYNNHQSRIKLIQKTLQEKIDLNEKPTISTLKTKKPSLVQDFQIVTHVLNLQNQKLAIYELLYPMAMVLALETPAQLIEQTITDNRNTNTWLRQIIQNVIGPQLSASQPE